MRLINTATLELEDFEYGRPAKGREQDGAGALEIQQFCALAAKHGYKWAWIDTCCIDKKSSAELSETINSMFKYYSKAAICYAYLSDVHVETFEDTFEIGNSQYWRRGWTIQELLAPTVVDFYNASWTFPGTKSDNSEKLSAITGIPKRCLESRKSGYEASIACKMSWASRRETTRREYMAYFLMGLLEVNMPLLYGEGKRAFMRLQLEIIRKSDESILAWQNDIAKGGMLAPSPWAFRDSGNIFYYSPPDETITGVLSQRPYAMTNRGLEIYKALFPTSNLDDDVSAFPLNCCVVDSSGSARMVAVLVRHFDISGRHGACWFPVKCSQIATMRPSMLRDDKPVSEMLLIRQPGL